MLQSNTTANMPSYQTPFSFGNGYNQDILKKYKKYRIKILDDKNLQKYINKDQISTFKKNLIENIFNISFNQNWINLSIKEIEQEIISMKETIYNLIRQQLQLINKRHRHYVQLSNQAVKDLYKDGYRSVRYSTPNGQKLSNYVKVRYGKILSGDQIVTKIGLNKKTYIFSVQEVIIDPDQQYIQIKLTL